MKEREEIFFFVKKIDYRSCFTCLIQMVILCDKMNVCIHFFKLIVHYKKFKKA
jgi:hypothetical protein